MPVPKKIFLWLSLPLVILITVSGIYSLFTPAFYQQESLNWQAQSTGQDIIDVFLIAPLLLLASCYLHKIKFAFYAWAGINLYIVYTYTIFCFAVHFNSLFFIYCFILGLSFYSLLLFIYASLKREALPAVTSHPKMTAIFLIITSLLFYAVWLMEIVPALLQQKTPALIKDTGLLTNPVWILDLAVVLPGIFSCGIFLLYKKRAGYALAPVILTFLILMNATIAFLSLFMQSKGVAEKDIIIPSIMTALAIYCIILLRYFLHAGSNTTVTHIHN